MEPVQHSPALQVHSTGDASGRLSPHAPSFLLPVQTLAPDTVPGVRLALSSACLELAPKLGQEVFVKQLLPLLEKFLTDNTTPDVKVRLNVLQVRPTTDHPQGFKE